MSLCFRSKRSPNWMSAPVKLQPWSLYKQILLCPYQRVSLFCLIPWPPSRKRLAEGTILHRLTGPNTVLEKHDRQPDGSAHIVMSQIPGDDLEDVISELGAAQVTSIVKELAGYLGQLRRLEQPGPKGAASSAAGEGNEGTTQPIGGVGGIPGHDVRLGSGGWGPFRSLADFHKHLRFGEPLEYWDHEPAVMAVHGKDDGAYKLKFTHADIALRNIRVKDGKIAGIVDWEFAGWYPEYWEYTKMHYGGAGVRPPWRKFFEAVEAEESFEKYKEELKAEEAIWARAGPFGYD